MDNLELMKTRLVNAGGAQKDRMIADRLKSLKKALKYSFEGENVIKLNETNSCKMMINPNQLKFSDDEKMVSIPFEDNIGTGDIFKWIFTDSYWLIYLQELTENAYFKGYAKKCKYLIKWEDDTNTVQSAWVAVEGPTQNSITSDTVTGKVIQDQPNYILNFYISNNTINQSFIKRYNQFLLNNRLWKITMVDDISKENIIHFTAIADLVNNFEDDLINNVAKGLVEKVIDPNAEDNVIIGETFIRPRMEYSYTIEDSLSTSWSIDCNNVEIISQTSNSIILKWISSVSGSFILTNGEYSKTILVKSLF